MSLSLGLLPLALVGLLVGVLIGCVGIGGVLLVPALTYLGGMDIQVAIASCMLSYLFSGLVGAIAYSRHGSIRWGMCGSLALGAMPGAYLGALAVSVVPGMWLEVLIAVLILFAGINALGERDDAGRPAVELDHLRLTAIGALTGFGSAMSGTGGPLILVPLLVWLNLPVLTAVGLSQVIQLPVASLATLGNLTHGRIDWAVGLGIALLLMLGVAVGARIAHRVSAGGLKRVVAFALIGVGTLIVARLGYPLLRAALA